LNLLSLLNLLTNALYPQRLARHSPPAAAYTTDCWTRSELTHLGVLEDVAYLRATSIHNPG
jgi:hypothetical protein